MNIWIILLIFIILVAAGILIFKTVAPAALELHHSSMAPIRSIAGDPKSLATVAALV